MGYCGNGKNNMIILIVLLIIIGFVSWSIIRRSNSNKERMTNPGKMAYEGAEYIPEQMSNQAIFEPELDYETIYGGANDNFGMGPGASSETTNDLTLL